MNIYYLLYSLYYYLTINEVFKKQLHILLHIIFIKQHIFFKYFIMICIK